MVTQRKCDVCWRHDTNNERGKKKMIRDIIQEKSRVVIYCENIEVARAVEKTLKEHYALDDKTLL